MNVSPIRMAADYQVAGGDPMCVLTKFQELPPPWHTMEERRGEEKDNDLDGFII